MWNFIILNLNNYFFILLLFIFSLLLALILIIISFFLINQNFNSEKLSAYECGYEPYENARHVFNINYSIIALFFLIFDIEILYILPWSISLFKIELLSFWSTIDFMFELIIGFFYIWYADGFSWE